MHPIRRPSVAALGALVGLLAAAGCRPHGDNSSDRTNASAGPGRLARRGATPRGRLPRITVPRLAGGAPTIDGVLDEPLWRGAAVTASFVNAGNGRALVGPPRGRVKLIYDRHCLYLGFEAEDATLTGGFALDAVDPQLWTRDTVEIIIDPDGDGDSRDYYEVQVNPQNLVFDSYFEGYNLPHGGPKGPFGHQRWSSKLRHAVTLKGTLDDQRDRDEGYVVEIALPWRAFHRAKHVPPRPGDEWRMNFYVMENNGGAAWSPLLGQGNFHRGSRFGRVTFGAH